jgi:hypothetical protein
VLLKKNEKLYYLFNLTKGNLMNIKQAAEKSGLTERAIRYQITKGTGIGRYFKRDTMGKWSVDGRLVKRVK